MGFQDPPHEPHAGGTTPSSTSAAETAEAAALTTLANPAEPLNNTGSYDPVGEDLDEETRLRLLATAKDQDQLERDIGRQADLLLREQADERDHKRIEKTEIHRDRLLGQIGKLDAGIAGPGGSVVKNRLRAERGHLQAQVDALQVELGQIQARIAGREQVGEDGGGHADEAGGGGKLLHESRREFLIRTGKITPFSKIGALRTSSNLADVMLDAEDEPDGDDDEDGSALESTAGPQSHRNLKRPGFQPQIVASDDIVDGIEQRHAKRRRVQRPIEAIETNSPVESSDQDFVPDLSAQQLAALGESDSGLSDFQPHTPPEKKRSRKNRGQHTVQGGEEIDEDLRGVDDGDEQVYRTRLGRWCSSRQVARRAAAQSSPITSESGEDLSGEVEEAMLEHEPFQPHPTVADTELEGGYRVPGDVYPSLFDYQKTGVRWLWELYEQSVGGIIGDEMGLGKTIQVIAFLAGLHYSRKLSKPIIVVAPATVMKQWVNEFHRWWPPLRVSILHTSGSGMMNLRRENQIEEDLEAIAFDDEADDKPKRSSGHTRAARKIVDRVLKDGHVLVTTYSGLQTYADLLLPTEWGYAVLDEGHKIRNPNTAITIYSKMLRTHNRLILSGTPMQNNLTELWSLFDFVFPMRLGTLVSFRNQFEMPIKMGGYANASNLQVETAMRCAESLKETISPYLLQRFKIDVAADLPKKTERVLFCKLTIIQKEAYTRFLNSEEMSSIVAGKRQALFGIDILRKICNHPDLVEHKVLSKKSNANYGNPVKSGKMQVVKALIELWKKGGHKTLLFAQHRIMLDILERFMQTLPNFNYLRMDGTTSIQERQNLVDRFNNEPELHVFLLTTKVGGLGVNLVGANRVIIYDPDWNPSTDVQARERAWRLGQKRDVEIYRLMTAGTIEEKIYHRQIFKQYLSNKILRDPKQRQTFQLRDLHDLFTFGDAEDSTTETGSMFKGTEIQFNDSTGEVYASVNSKRNTASGEDKAAADIEALRGVQRQEKFEAEAEVESTRDAANADGKEKPDRLLSTIFARSGVHSAHEHDAIIGGNGSKHKVTADPETIAREARRVASKAASELRRAGEVARSIPAGVPTWTGLHGTTGRPEERSRMIGLSRGGFGSGRRGGAAGPSSSAVLANLAARQRGTVGATNIGSADSSRASTPQRGQLPRGKDFMMLIRDFLKAQGGSAYTQMLVDHFNRYCGTPERTVEFKEMLRQIAELDKGPRGRGRGRWVLKDEWK